MYIALFLQLLQWNLKISNIVPRLSGPTWSGPGAPFHLTFHHCPHCPLSNSTDLPATRQKQKQTKRAPASRPSHLLFSLPKCCSSDLHASWSFSSSKSQVLPPLRPSVTTLPKTATVSLPVIFITAFTTTYIILFNICVCLLSVKAPRGHVSHIDCLQDLAQFPILKRCVIIIFQIYE